MKSWKESQQARNQPTPGVDDTPYIQFAIDQLTRDEELLGRSRDQSGSPEISSISDENFPHLPQASSKASSKLAVRNSDADKEIMVPPKTVHPAHRNHSISSLSDEHDQGIEHDIIGPAHPPSRSVRYPPLTFIPGPLRLLPLAALAACCVALIMLLIVSCVIAAKSDGLVNYDGVGTSRYFLVQYLPQLLAVLVVIWLQVTQASIQRILPFVLLSDIHHDMDTRVMERVPLYITNYLLPNRYLMRRGQPLLAICAASFWLNLFTVPLASSLYQSRYYGSENGSWAWTVVQPVAIILIFIYTLVIISLCLLFFSFHNRTTGLKWDPISLADLFVLLRRSTSPSDRPVSDLRSLLHSRPASLGYWESTGQPGSFFHGIDTANAPTRLHVEKKNRHIADEEDDLEAQGPPLQTSTFESWHSRGASKGKQRPQPWFLRETYIILFPIISIVLLVAFLALSFTNHALLTGFSPLFPSATTSTNFSASNFFYSFIPAVIGTLLPLLWQPIDITFRYLQPYASMSKTFGGARSQDSILLSYTANWPGLTTLKALRHGHFRIAWFSFQSLISWTIPILAGGLFTAQWTPSPTDDSRILMRVDPGALYALMLFLILYAISWLIVFPTSKRMLRNGWDVRYLWDIKESVDLKTLRSEVWREPRSRIDLVTRLVSGDHGVSKRLTGGNRFKGRWVVKGGRVVRV